MENTRKLIQTIILLLIVTGCAKQKELSTRDVVISLIEKNFYTDGRKLEYSQIDSTDAELKGYLIGRIYIDNNDSIRCDKFHINYLKNKVDVLDQFTISSDMYKSLLINEKIFSNDINNDFQRIYRVLGGIDSEHSIDMELHRHYYDSIRIADSIANSVPFE